MPSMFRKLLATASSSAPTTISVGASAPHFFRASAACLVAGSLNVEPSRTATVPRSACRVRAARRALRRALRLTLTV
jgi:hypothetical protein